MLHMLQTQDGRGRKVPMHLHACSRQPGLKRMIYALI